MFLRAGFASLVLLLASRVLGLARESAQAAAFGATGLGDVAVLLFSLPDWIASVVAGGALAYALLPAWAHQGPAERAAMQRRVARWLLAAGAVLGLLLAVARSPIALALAGGLPTALRGAVDEAMVWAAVALLPALLASLWVARLQHEQDFLGMYAANLVVNGVLIVALAGIAGGAIALARPDHVLFALGSALIIAMLLRLAWLAWRLRRHNPVAPGPVVPPLPGVNIWLWAALAAGLPLALPFAARSIASQGGEGSLATFNYAWKLVELPLQLAIQLVAAIALPAIVRGLALEAHQPGDPGTRAIRSGFALAWAIACAAAAGLTVAAPAVAGLLFGWGRMQPEALAQVAEWGRIGAWSLLPQALIAVGVAVLAAKSRMRAAALGYAIALAALLAAGTLGTPGGTELMWWLDALLLAVAGVVVAALGPRRGDWLPWPALAAGALGVLACQLLHLGGWLPAAAPLVQLSLGLLAALAVFAACAGVSHDVRAALRR